jgi:tRNA nucleotidyltransferase/poly(A) polymerase
MNTVTNGALQQLQAIATANGGAVWLVGGTARDLLRGQPPKDWDVVVTGVVLDTLKAQLSAGSFAVDAFGTAFGVLKATWQDDNGYTTTLDIALPREEVSNGPGHRDFVVRPDPNLALERDLARRDFTINAIAVALADDGAITAIIDPFAGLADLQNGIIRAVGNPAERFIEDPLRIWRALRFQARLGFEIESRTLLAMQKATPLLETISGPRLRDEVLGFLSSSNPQALALAWRTGLSLGIFSEDWSAVLPEQPSVITRLALAWPSFYPPIQLKAWQLPLGQEQNLKTLLSAKLEQIDELSLRHWLVKTGNLWPQVLWLLRQHQPQRDWPAIEAQLQPLAWLAGFTVGDLALKGQDILALLEAEPGPIIGQWQRQLLQAVIAGAIENTEDALTAYVLAQK